VLRSNTDTVLTFKFYNMPIHSNIKANHTESVIYSYVLYCTFERLRQHNIIMRSLKNVILNKNKFNFNY